MAYEPECPICGQPMMSIETHPGRGELYCHTCDLVLCGDHAKTPEELVALIDGSAYMREKAENAKLVELLLKSFELMHRGGLTTGAYGPCMELFEEAEDIGVIVPFMSELGIEDE